MTHSKAFLAGGVLLAAAFAVPAAPAAASDALTPAQKSAVEALVHDYILKNPETLIQSLRDYEEKQRVSAQEEAQKAIVSNRDAIERDPGTPVAGNPKGDVTVVEFFDYRCGYCKKALPAVQELLKSDPNIRWVFKELPILGPDSVVASQAALAVWKIAPDKYLAFHVAMMESRGEINEARIMDTARKVGVDPDKLKSAMADPEIKARIERTYELARTLQVNGTPAFIVGGKLVPGALDLATLRDMVKAARAG